MIELLKKYKVYIFCSLLLIFNMGWYVIKDFSKEGTEVVLSEESQNKSEDWQAESTPEPSLMPETNRDESKVQPVVQSVSLTTKTVSLERVPVYICGEVINPGVYYVKQDAILYDVLMMCGGATKEADMKSFNLASNISPHQKIYLPKVGEEIDKSLNSYENKNDTSLENGSSNITAQNSVTADNSAASTQQQIAQLININTANEEELQTLSGIGKAKAKAIIDYRTSVGAFKTIDDLLNVSGIGEKTLEKIRNCITV